MGSVNFGIDISAWQKGLDLRRAVSEDKITFAIIKFGGADCGLYRDKCAEDFYLQCLQIGIPVGAYFFSSCSTVEQAEKEADYFISLIKDKQFSCKVWYDIEGSMQYLSKEMLNNIAKAFCKKVKDAGFDCGVYSSLSVFKKIDYDGSFSKDYPMWVACWGSTKPSMVRDGIDMWQFGGETNLIRTNKIAGKTVDQDYAYFTIPGVKPQPTPQLAVPLPTLRYGMKNESVRQLQKCLIKLGYSCGYWGADGSYGPATKSAVQEFQKDVFDDKKEWDGIYGPKTYNKMLLEEL